MALELYRPSVAESVTFSKATSVRGISARAKGWLGPIATLQRAFLNAVDDMVGAPWRDVQAALEDGNERRMLQLFEWDEALFMGNVREAMVEAFRGGGGWELSVSEEEGHLTFEPDELATLEKKKPRRVVDLTTQEAMDWLRGESLDLVRDLSNRRLTAIRALLSDGIGAGDTYQALAKRMLRLKLAGLLPAQQRAVRNFLARRLKDGVPRGRAELLTERYAKKALHFRAETIAKTEMAKAWAEGQIAGWRQAQRDGLISKRAQQEWVTVDPCVVCEPLEGKRAAIGGRFYPGGYRRPGDTHPRCECSLILVTPATRSSARRTSRRR